MKRHIRSLPTAMKIGPSRSQGRWDTTVGQAQSVPKGRWSMKIKCFYSVIGACSLFLLWTAPLGRAQDMASQKDPFLQTLQTTVRSQPEILEWLTRISPEVLSCPTQAFSQGIHILWEGKITSTGAPFRMRLHIIPGASVGIRCEGEYKIYNIFSHVEGELTATVNQKLKTWPIKQENFGDLFARSSFNPATNRIGLFLPMMVLAPPEPVLAILIASCVVEQSELRCDKVRFGFHNLVSQQHRSRRSIYELLGISKYALRNRLGAGARAVS